MSRTRAAARRVWTDAAANVRMWWRSPTSVFFAVAFPLIFITIFGAIFGEDEQRYDLYVQDLDDTSQSHDLVAALVDTGALNVHDVPADRSVDALIAAEDPHSVLVVPSGYGRALVLGNEVTLRLVQDPSRTQAAPVAAIVRLVAVEADLATADARDRAAGGDGIRQVEVARESRDGAALDGSGIDADGTDEGTTTRDERRYIDYLLPGVVGMTIATNALIGGLERAASLYETKVMRKVATTPIGRWEWVLGKALYQVFLGIVSTIVIVIVGYLLFRVHIRPSPLLLVLVPSASVLFASIALILSRWVRRSDAANTAGSTVLFPQMFLTGVFFPLETMPEYLRVVAQALPLTYVNNALRAAMVTGHPSVWWDGSIVVGLAVVGVVAAALLLDRQEH